MSIPILNSDLNGDILSKVIESISFESELDSVTKQVDSKLSDLATDKTTQAWVKKTIKVIWTLVHVTSFSNTSGCRPLAAHRRFSYMEALYSRGFDSPDSIAVLSQSQFLSALAGTIIEPDDGKIIYENGKNLPNSLPSTGAEPKSVFKPANSGSLVNCIPQANLSPLGYIEYLHEMLAAKSGDMALLKPVSSRRGDIGSLHTTMANLESQIPIIDLVLESLEFLGSGIKSPVGVVYNTMSDSNSLGDSEEKSCMSADDFFSAVPEHSSPAVKLKNSVVYDKLKACFTSPDLPYSQPLDMCRSYLSAIGTNRSSTLHRFRHDITEFPLDPTQNPESFQKHVYRLPVQLDIALEYLRISKNEYETLYKRKLEPNQVAMLYGLDTTESKSWEEDARNLATILSGLGLKYCDILQLQKSCYVRFKITKIKRQPNGEEFDGEQVLAVTDYPPCCLKQWQLQFGGKNNLADLKQLAIFVRLWKTLNLRCHEEVSFNLLADICNSIGLNDFQGNINSEFIRQLAALIMLHEQFGLPWSDNADDINASGIARTTVLRIWDKPSISSPEWASSVDVLLHCVEKYAREEFLCCSRGPGFLKTVADNLEALSRLAGFIETVPWFSNPVCTIRFVEVLAKIYASNFTIGEILFLFTVSNHLQGDDPFPLGTEIKSIDRPLSLPDDHECNLEALRKKLMLVDISEEDCETHSWHELESIIRDTGYTVQPNGANSLICMAEHFFPGVLEAHGHHVDPEKRRFSTPLAPDQTSPQIWASDPCRPYHYNSDGAEGSLWVSIPLKDEDVFEKLKAIRQLRQEEADAIQELYFMPRVALAPFAPIFSNFHRAVNKMIQEPNERDRFNFFRQQVLVFHRRCKIIAQHLAEHVKEAATNKYYDRGCVGDDEVNVAWVILKSLAADENIATGNWEDDESGRPPATFTWDHHFSGSAFSGILGLIGTGLHGEIKSYSGNRWAEMRGGLDVFGHINNELKTPVPTIIPDLSLKPTTAQNNLVDFKNGFATRNKDDKFLAGAERFTCEWTGNLILEESGSYIFNVEKPKPEDDKPNSDGCNHNKWMVELQRGQKQHLLLSHGEIHETAPAYVSNETYLHKGTYEIKVTFEEKDPVFDRFVDIRNKETGFQVKYEGPDTKSCSHEVPFHNLIISFKDKTLGHSLELSHAKGEFLRLEYISSLRDIRRTYQRAFKALLFTKKFCLSATTMRCDGMSELLYILNHAQQFQGNSFFRETTESADDVDDADDADDSDESDDADDADDVDDADDTDDTEDTGNKPTFNSHHVWFDFNFLPVGDPFISPDPKIDSRARPSEKRQAALFDWWERTFDYVLLRKKIGAVSKRPLWRIFQEAELGQPLSGVENLLHHMKIDPSIKNLVLNYYKDGSTVARITPADLLDERWATRLWYARNYVKKLFESFYSNFLENARPALWAADDFEADITIKDEAPESGNRNLTRFVQRSMLDSQQRSSRLSDLCKLNNGLRQRCRNAILTYLCQMHRVELPWGGHANSPRDLTELLLQDVEAHITETSSRIEDAIRSVQTFVQRARIGLETGLNITEGFSKVWDSKFANFETWVACRRRFLYGENWIKWDELRALENMEGSQVLQTELRRSVNTILKPGNRQWQPTYPPIANSGGIELVHSNEMVTLPLHKNSTTEHISLEVTPGEGSELAAAAARKFGSIPTWIQAAIRLGSRFIRVAAAGTPPAFPWTDRELCCDECGKKHAPCIDEYYFWLQDSQAFDDKDATQDADDAWEDGKESPALLTWPHYPNVLLFWARVHAGSLCQPRCSSSSVRVDLSKSRNAPFLKVIGRNFDSLYFTVTREQTEKNGPIGSDPGFRYDIATDSAIVTPQVRSDVLPTQNLPPSFVSYPWFIYFKPGKPLTPITPFGTALAIAGTFQTNCQFEMALNWYRVAYDPLKRDNTWTQSTEPGNDTTSIPVEHNSCCPILTANPPVLRSRAVFLDYLDNLLSWSDQLAAKKTTETAQQASVLLEMMNKLLGSAPLTVNARPGAPAETMTVSTFAASPPPINPRLLKLYEEVSNRMLMIRSRKPSSEANFDCRRCGNLTGGCWSMGTGDACRASYCQITLSQPYRFGSIFPKATELASLTKSLAKSLLAAYERGDQEYLVALRSTHEHTMLNLGLEALQNEWRAADWDLQALGKTMEHAGARLSNYQMLINKSNTTHERSYVREMEKAIAASNKAKISAGFELERANDNDEESHIPTTMMSTAASNHAKILADLELTRAGWERRLEELNHQVRIINIEIAQIKRQKLASTRRRDMALTELNNHKRQIEHSQEVLDFMRDKFTKNSLDLFLQQEHRVILKRMFELALRMAHDAYAAFIFERFPASPPSFPSISDLWDGGFEGHMAGDKLELSLRQLERSYMSTNCREFELSKHFSLRESFPQEFISLRQHGACEIELKEWRFDADYPGHYMRRIKSISLSIPCDASVYTGVHCKLQLLGSSIRTEPLLPGLVECCCSKSKNKVNFYCCPSCNEKSDKQDPYLLRRYAAASAVATSHGQNDSGLFELSFRDNRYLPFEFEGAVSRWRIELPQKNNLFDFSTLSDVILNLNYTSRDGGPDLQKIAEQKGRGRGDKMWKGFEAKREFSDIWPKFEEECRPSARDNHHKCHHQQCYSCSSNHSKANEVNNDEKHKEKQIDSQCGCSGSHKPHQDLQLGYAEFPLRLRRDMFPYLPGRPDIKVTHLCVYLSVRREYEDDTSCTCNDRYTSKHFPTFLIPPGRENCPSNWYEAMCVQQQGYAESPCSDVYVCEIGNLNLGPIAEGRGMHMNAIEEAVGMLRFPKGIGNILEMWLLCKYEPVRGCEGDGMRWREPKQGGRRSSREIKYSCGVSQTRGQADENGGGKRMYFMDYGNDGDMEA